MSNNTFSDKRTRTKTKRYSPTHDDNGYLHPKGNKGNSHYYRGELGSLNYFGKIVRLDINDNENDNIENDTTQYDKEFIVGDNEIEYEINEDSKNETESEYETGSDDSDSELEYETGNSNSESENEEEEIQRLTQLASDIIKEMDYDMWKDWTNN